FHVFVSTTTSELLAGLGDRTDTNILVRSIENATWNGLGNSPFQVGDLTNVTFVHFRGSGSEMSNTGMLFCRRLFIMLKCLPSGLNPASWAGHLTSANSTSQTSGPLATFLTDRFPGDPSGMCRQQTGSHVDRSITRAADAIRMTSAEYRLPGWWTTASSPTRVLGDEPGIWPRSTSSSAIGTISQLILFPAVPSYSS